MHHDQCCDAFGTLNTTYQPGGLITMSIYISDGKTMDDGLNAMNAFQEFLRPMILITSHRSKAIES
jgi:hypothetical protein